MSRLPRVPSLLFPPPNEGLASLTGEALTKAIQWVAQNQGLTQDNRLFRLEIGHESAGLDGALLLSHVDIKEQVCEDASVQMRLLCISTRPDIPESVFLGQPVSVSVVTERGTLRRINAIITKASAGPWSGSERLWLVEAVDWLTMLEKDCLDRAFVGGSVLNLIDGTLQMSLQGQDLSPFVDWELPWHMRDHYPEREFRMQMRESTRAFIQRHARRYGLGWRVKPGSRQNPEGRGHTIEFFDSYTPVPVNDAGTVAFQRDWATQPLDAINEWMSESQLTPGAVNASSWDHQSRGLSVSLQSNPAIQGNQRSAIATALAHQFNMPTHWGDDDADFNRMTYRRGQHHAMQSRLIKGESSLRDALCFTSITVTGLPGDALARVATSVVFTQVHHCGQNNYGPEVDQRIQALMVRAGWQAGHLQRPANGRQGVEQVQLGDADSSHYRNTFTAVPAGTSIVPEFDLDKHWPKAHPITAIVIGRTKGDEVHCDEWGRYAVCFPGVPTYGLSSGMPTLITGTLPDQFPVNAYPERLTSAYIPLATPQGSNGFGVNTPPRAGDQMLVNFLYGSTDHPVLTGALHSKWYPHARAEGQQAMPGNRNIASIREKEVGSQRASELLIDSTPGQTRVQLDSDHTHSRISLGYQTTPRRDGRAEAIGEGLYHSTDAASATRAAKGILQSAWARLNGSGKQLDYQEALNLMETGLALFKSMGEYAARHQGATLDAASQTELKDTAANWQAGTNTDPKAPPRDTAIIAMTAPQGIAANTPKTIAQFAGENVDTVARQHMQLIAGQRYSVNAGQGISQFAHDGGIRHIAHNGQLLMQAQHGDIVGEAVGDIRFATANGTIRHYAKAHELIAADGSFIRIGDGVTIGTNGPIRHQAASFPHSGPATMSADAPGFNADSTSLRFVARLATVDGPPAPLTRYEIVMNDGSKVSGTTDAEGATSVQMKDAMHIARVTLLDPEE
jgi:type VI secretion system secreted protein VgrG